MIIVNCKWCNVGLFICLYLHLHIPDTVLSILNNLTHWNIITTWWTRFFCYPHFTEEAAVRVDYMICSDSQLWVMELGYAVRLQSCILIAMHLLLDHVKTQLLMQSILPRVGLKAAIQLLQMFVFINGLLICWVFKTWDSLSSIIYNHDSFPHFPYPLFCSFLLATEKKSQLQLLILELNGSQYHPGFPRFIFSQRIFVNGISFPLCTLRSFKVPGNPWNYIHVSGKMVND